MVRFLDLAPIRSMKSLIFPRKSLRHLTLFVLKVGSARFLCISFNFELVLARLV